VVKRSNDSVTKMFSKCVFFDAILHQFGNGRQKFAMERATWPHVSL